ncbi:MAG: YbgC/FadM family acyl-CoA thioesterase [Comamonadaceae bacterium]|nr:MAG: YbgC/FadM family acyl-CoA thioesterase [Comamonadaceae bacterium]
MANDSRSQPTAPNAVRSDFRFFHRLRVRWAEVDIQKIVFNPHYLMYFDVAVTDYWRALALPYEDAMQVLGGDMYLRKAGVEFHRSAHFDERLDVALKCRRVGNSSIIFDGAIFRGQELLIGVELVYVFADPSSQTPTPVPAVFRALLSAFEAGEKVVEVRTGNWSELGESLSPLREAVFVAEQGIAHDVVFDELDRRDSGPDATVHAVACNRIGQPLATGRLTSQAPGVGKIGRMAVHRMLRGAHLGRDILHALVESARRRGDHEIVLYAQQSAEGFYLQLGFTTRGEPFEEAGLPHVQMFRSLRE